MRGCGMWAVRDEGRDVWRDDGCAIFVSSSWRFVGRWRRRGWMRAGGVPWAWWWCYPHASSFFFLPLVSNEAGGGCVFSSRGSVSYRRLVYSVSVCVSSGRLAFLSCGCLVMASRRGAVSTPFVFFCLCVLLVAMIGGSCRSVCLVSRFARRLVLSVLFFFLSSSERVAMRGARRSARVGVLFPSCGEGVLFPHYDWLDGERDGADGDAPFYSARFLIFTVSELMLATGIVSMTRMRRRRNDWQ